MTSPDGLSDKQRRFCDEYLVDFNATRAAVAAGYSKKTAVKIGSENLRKPDVQAYLAARTTKVAEKLGFKAEDTIGGLIKIAQFDIRKLLDFGVEQVELPPEKDKDGKPLADAAPRYAERNFVRLKPSAELDDATAFALTGITLKRDGSLQVRVADKKGALDTLARHQDLVKEAFEVEMKGRTLIEGAPNEREIARQVALLLTKGARAQQGGGPRK